MGASEANDRRLDCETCKDASYLEIEIACGCVNLFERQGDGKTAEIVRVLARYGLHLVERVSSPCG